jgi:hypothetical protein
MGEVYMKLFIAMAILAGAAITACTMGAKRDVAERTPATVGEKTVAGLTGWKDTDENAKLWSEYCVGNPKGADIPHFKYNSNASFVKEAIANLKKVDDKSYFLYTEVEEVYGVREPGSKKGDKKPLAKQNYAIPDGVSGLSNGYLTILCGEFRDRATMIQDKVKWLAHLYKLPVTPQTDFVKKIDITRSPWSQMSADRYDDFLAFSRNLWSARKQVTPSVDYGGGQQPVDGAVEGMTVCQVKYMFANYIHAGKPFDSLSAYESGFKNFKSQCSDGSDGGDDDINDYYTFRGDTNFKPYSPEGNAMLFRGRFMASLCKNPSEAKSKAPISDEDCQTYYTKPFENRWAAARAGLAGWMFYEPGADNNFTNTSMPTTMHLHYEGGERPLNYSLDSMGTDPKPGAFAENLFHQDWIKSLGKDGLKGGYLNVDMGFNKFTRLDTGSPLYALAYKRIKNAVDRHTDWYASGYSDAKTNRKGDQAYSPFVASSYEMGASNSFVNCGITVPCIAGEHDQRKHWMFVFRVHGKNWYKTQDLKANKPVDFSRMWFDETSFGTTGLAKSEHAWDRLGTAVEGEYDSILYLHNITTSNSIQGDGLPQ